MAVREFVEHDIPQVTSLYWNYMRSGRGPVPRGLEPLFRELYFANPWVDRSSPSFVYENKSGEIMGFLGVTRRPIRVCDQPMRVAYGGNFVVHPEARHGVAAPRLLDAYLSGNHDLWLTDSANDITRHLLERLGFRTIPALNIHWVWPLKPSHFAVHALSRSAGPVVSAAAKFAAKPFCVVADSLASRIPRSPFRLVRSPLRGSELDVNTLLRCFAEFRKNYSLWTEYDADSLRWLLSFMERRTKRGVLRKIALRDAAGQIVGSYIYYVKRGGVGEVVQVGGQPKCMKTILDHLAWDAVEQGVVALHGVVNFQRMPDFSEKGCLFTCRGGWTIARSTSSEALKVLERGDAFLSRLDGEWSLDPGD